MIAGKEVVDMLQSITYSRHRFPESHLHDGRSGGPGCKVFPSCFGKNSGPGALAPVDRAQAFGFPFVFVKLLDLNISVKLVWN